MKHVIARSFSPNYHITRSYYLFLNPVSSQDVSNPTIFVFPPSLTINLLNIQFWPWLIWPYCASILALAMGQAVPIDVLINGSFGKASTNPFTNNQREVMAYKKQESVWCLCCCVVLYNSSYFSEQISVLDTYLTKILPQQSCSERSWHTQQFVRLSSFICSPPLSLSWAIRSSGGMPSMPYISSSMLSRPAMALGTFVTISLCTWEQWMASPGAVYSFLWQTWHLKCLAFWWKVSTFSSSKSRLQYLIVLSQGHFRTKRK